MKNDRSQQCPEGINIVVVSAADLSEAKGRKSRTRRLKMKVMPGDRVLALDQDGDIAFDIAVSCFGTVSTVVPLDK